MPVDLSPYYELDIDQAILDFAPENYCANCQHFEMQDDDTMDATVGTPYCLRWEEETEVKSGMICPEYRPQGYD